MYMKYQLRAVTLLKRSYWMLLALSTTVGLAVSSHATDLVNDTWRDGLRTDPASPTYAENNGVIGVDADADGDLESAWFMAGSGTLAVVTNNPPISGPNILEGTTSTSSSSWYTYFTQPGTPVTLSNPGDELKLTWAFTPNGVNASNTSQGFLLALALTPSGLRNTADGSVQSANYTNAFAMFMNMGTQFNSTSSYELRKWGLAGSGALLGTSANWAVLTNTVGKGGIGYLSGTNYTFVFDMQLTASGLQVTSTMTGDNIKGTGTMTDTYLDSSISSVSFDTFDIRPSSTASTATTFDTSLFKVEFITIPEPSTWVLVGTGLGLMIGLVRRQGH